MSRSTKGGKHQSLMHAKLCSHVAAYYLHLAKAINTDCPMYDYCAKDVYLTEAMRNLK